MANVKVIECINGHFYDGDLYSTCPHCPKDAVARSIAEPPQREKKGFWNRGRRGKEVKEYPVSPMPPVRSQEEYSRGNSQTDVLESGKEQENKAPAKTPPTQDFWDYSSHSESSSPAVIREEPVSKQEIYQQPVSPLQEEHREEKRAAEGTSALQEAVKQASASNEGKTMSYFSSAIQGGTTEEHTRPVSEPVVGWLVCVKGYRFGECFGIYAGNNSIGRSSSNRIVIAGDDRISKEKHAFVIYEPKRREFYLNPGDSSGLTYLNDEFLREGKKLCSHDMIELGDSKFLFVPLCTEGFSWEEYLPKGV